MKPLPSPYSAIPSRGGNVAKAFIKIIRLRNCIYRGLGRCPSSQYAFSLAHAYSARLRFYGHVLLILKKSSIFREPYPSRRLYLCNRDSHHSKLIFRRGRLPRRPACHINSKYHIMRIWDFLEFKVPVNLYSHVGEPIARPVALCQQQLRAVIDIAHLV